MSDGRVTIECHCKAVATHINFYGKQPHEIAMSKVALCDLHTTEEIETDAEIRRTDKRWVAWTAALINPGTCSESDVLAVRTAIEAMCRLLRTRGDSPEDIEDRAVLELCAQEVRDTYYRRCEGIYHSYSGPRWEPCEWRTVDDCKHCNGSGLVVRRRSDGTAVIDEIDAGSVAA